MTGTERLGGLPSDIARQIQTELSRHSQVRQAILFGSRAMGTHRRNSDIDLCLDAPDMPFAEFLQLAAILDEQVLPYGLDLVLKHHIDNPAFLEHIQRVGVVVYSRVSAVSAS